MFTRFSLFVQIHHPYPSSITSIMKNSKKFAAWLRVQVTSFYAGCWCESEIGGKRKFLVSDGYPFDLERNELHVIYKPGPWGEELRSNPSRFYLRAVCNTFWYILRFHKHEKRGEKPQCVFSRAKSVHLSGLLHLQNPESSEKVFFSQMYVKFPEQICLRNHLLMCCVSQLMYCRVLEGRIDVAISHTSEDNNSSFYCNKRLSDSDELS